MTGAYLRVQRDGKWGNLEVEDLTDDERQEILGHREPAELVRWINLLCKTVITMNDTFNDAVDEAVKEERA